MHRAEPKVALAVLDFDLLAGDPLHANVPLPLQAAPTRECGHRPHPGVAAAGSGDLSGRAAQKTGRARFIRPDWIPCLSGK